MVAFACVCDVDCGVFLFLDWAMKRSIAARSDGVKFMKAAAIAAVMAWELDFCVCSGH